MSDNKTKIAVFISGNGTNLQALIDATKSGKLDAEICLVVSSKEEAYGLERAKKEKIEAIVYNTKNFDNQEKADEYLLGVMKKHEIEFIALSGYLKMISVTIINNYKDKIVNIHPALLPKYGGKGMYGKLVHDAVIKNREEESGATVHLVNEVYDEGKILAQEKVPVFPEDLPEELAARVLKIEHELYPKTLDKLIKGKI